MPSTETPWQVVYDDLRHALGVLGGLVIEQPGGPGDQARLWQAHLQRDLRTIALRAQATAEE